MKNLMAAFNQVTSRLEATHDQLRSEVARLTSELNSANEQLERSSRLSALGEMAAGIAHEVRNPLGSIRLYARLLDQDLADRPGERATVGKIASAAKHLDGIVGDVLTFSREFRLRREPVDVGASSSGPWSAAATTACPARPKSRSVSRPRRPRSLRTRRS